MSEQQQRLIFGFRIANCNVGPKFKVVFVKELSTQMIMEGRIETSTTT